MAPRGDAMKQQKQQPNGYLRLATGWLGLLVATTIPSHAAVQPGAPSREVVAAVLPGPGTAASGPVAASGSPVAAPGSPVAADTQSAPWTLLPEAAVQALAAELNCRLGKQRPRSGLGIGGD